MVLDHLWENLRAYRHSKYESVFTSCSVGPWAGGARRSQREPGVTRRSQEAPRGTWRSKGGQEEPGGVKRNQEEPGRVRRNKRLGE